LLKRSPRYIVIQKRHMPTLHHQVFQCCSAQEKQYTMRAHHKQPPPGQQSTWGVCAHSLCAQCCLPCLQLAQEAAEWCHLWLEALAEATTCSRLCKTQDTTATAPAASAMLVQKVHWQTRGGEPSCKLLAAPHACNAGAEQCTQHALEEDCLPSGRHTCHHGNATVAQADSAAHMWVHSLQHAQRCARGPPMVSHAGH
jgi:hypothetical protein